MIVGDGHAEIHEPACAKALRMLGHEVSELYWYSSFRNSSGMGRDEFRSMWLRAQNRFIFGSAIESFNREVLETFRRARPHLVIFYRGTHILPSTVRALRLTQRRPLIVSFNNDDPFSPGADRLLWRHFKACIPFYDMNFVYRHSNIDDYEQHGGRNVHLLRSYFIPWRHLPLDVSPAQAAQLGGDVVFAGHYEPDGRVEYLRAVAGAGFDLRIYGPGWNKVLRGDGVLSGLLPVKYLDSETYNVVLNVSRISLCFLSALNRDTYTRRCFEITASGGFLLSQYSDDLASLFVEGLEAEFFRTKEELLNKIRYYLADESLRRSVAARGRERVRRDGHDVVSRMKYVTNTILEAYLAYRSW